MLTAKDLMTKNPDVVAPETSLGDVVAMMNRSGYRHRPVVDGEKLVGIITERDIRLAVNSPLLTEDMLLRIQMLNRYSVEDCMTRDPLTLTPDMPMPRIADLFVVYKYGALPVVEDDTLVGIVTVIDLLHYLAKQEELVAV